MDIYCTSCRKKTASKKEAVLVNTVNGRWRTSTECAVCGHAKSTFIKTPPSVVQAAEEVHKRVIKKFPRRRIVTLGVDDLWAADLVIMRKYANVNDGYRYMLNIIDTFSKFAWSEPLMTKTGVEVAKSFSTILKRAMGNNHTAPNLLHTDKGTEFVNRDFKRLMETHRIKMYHTENEEKSAIVERFNRTLNEKMKVRFELMGSFRWIDILQDVLKQYNTSTHRTIGMRPADVTKADEQHLLRKYGSSPPVPKCVKLKPGDRVRIVAKKDTFANKYSRNWTREIFTVSKVLDTAPITYRINDKDGEEIIGSFYEKELQKTACD